MTIFLHKKLATLYICLQYTFLSPSFTHHNPTTAAVAKPNGKQLPSQRAGPRDEGGKGLNVTERYKQSQAKETSDEQPLPPPHLLRTRWQRTTSAQTSSLHLTATHLVCFQRGRVHQAAIFSTSTPVSPVDPGVDKLPCMVHLICCTPTLAKCFFF